ncbi:hypothetical protein C5167_026956 [Papaver somniferum]|nr:hypothetical protein C5167_026956 [Papaver somniferum]
MAASPAPAKNCFYKNLLPKVSPSRRCENLNMSTSSYDDHLDRQEEVIDGTKDDPAKPRMYPAAEEDV